MFPCNPYSPQTPALYTYYAIMSLIVVVLAISLIWLPVVHLIAELNTIIVKVLIFTSKELLGNTNTCILHYIEAFFCSQYALLIISISCILYIMYLASGDFLIFAGCYVCNLPNHKYLHKIKRAALGVIEYLLNLTGKRRIVDFEDSNPIKYCEAANKSENQEEDDESKISLVEQIAKKDLI